MENNFQSEIDIKKFERGKRICKSDSAVVYQAIDLESGKFFAAKVIDCEDCEEQYKKAIEHDINLMKSICHPVIVKIFAYSPRDFHDENNLTIIMEFVKNGSLLDIFKQIRNNNIPINYTNTTRQIILIGIAGALKYLHDNFMIHRNLIPGHILLDDEFHPHVTPFGIYQNNSIDHLSSQNKSIQNMPYLAPEYFEYHQYDERSDVYSFGILMYEIVTNSAPYPDILNGKVSEFDFKRKIVDENYRPEFNTPIKKSVQQMIEKCFSANPNNRPTISEIFNWLSKEPLFENIDGQKIDLYCNYINEAYGPAKQLYDRLMKVSIENDQLKKAIEKLKEENQQIKQELKQLAENKKKTIDSQVDLNIDVFKFNGLPLKSQQNISKKFSNHKNGKIKQFFLNLNKLGCYILNKCQGGDLKCIEIEANGSTSLNDLDMRPPILIRSSIFDTLPIDQDLLQHLDKFKSIIFELLFPTETYQRVYYRILDIIQSSRNSKRKLEISVFITGIPRTSMKFSKDNTISIVKLDSSVKEIASVESKGRTINNYIGSFEGCTKLERVEMMSVQKIGHRAFGDCASLSEVVIPLSVTELGSSIFYNCSSLKRVVIPATITSIPERTFEKCSCLVDITIPRSVTAIKDYAFYGCTSIESMKIPDSVVSVGSYAFYGCKLLADVELSSFITSIKDYTFYECASLSKIVIPPSVTSLGSHSFSMCSSLKSIDIPSSVTEIGEKAFYECCSLAQVTIPPSITEIMESTFYGCSSLAQIVIPSSVTRIGKNAFNYCYSLTQITIPKSVIEVGSSAFFRCSSLNHMTVPHSLDIRQSGIQNHCKLTII